MLEQLQVLILNVLSECDDLAVERHYAAQSGPGLRSARVHRSTVVRDAFLPSFHPGLQQNAESEWS